MPVPSRGHCLALVCLQTLAGFFPLASLANKQGLDNGLMAPGEIFDHSTLL